MLKSSLNLMKAIFTQIIIKKIWSLINDINLMNESYMNILKNEVLVNLKKCNCDSDSISNISSMFDDINNQFNLD
jgi:hypothetical protein